LFIREGFLLRSEREGGEVLLLGMWMAAMSAKVNSGVGKADLHDSMEVLRSRHMPRDGC